MAAPAESIALGRLLTDLEDPGTLAFQYRGEDYFAVRFHGRLRVYRNRCPHRRATLHGLEHDFLDDSGTLIRCAVHGALFLIESGECVSGPCQGEYLQAVAFRQEGDRLYLVSNS